MPTIAGASEKVLGQFWDIGGLVHNVKHPNYGAVGDGVADDTVALRLAIAAAAVYGGKVVLPQGIYGVTGDLDIPEHVVLEGVAVGGLRTTSGTTLNRGSVIKWIAGGAPVAAVVTANLNGAATGGLARGIGLRNLRVDANGHTNAVRLRGLGEGCVVENVMVESFSGIGFELSPSTGTVSNNFGVSVNGLTGAGLAGSEGIVISGAYNCAFRDLRVVGAAGILAPVARGLNVRGTTVGCTFQNLRFFDCSQPVDVGIDGGVSGNTFSDIRFSAAIAPLAVTVGAYTGTIGFLVRTHATRNRVYSIFNLVDGRGYGRAYFDQERGGVITGPVTEAAIIASYDATGDTLSHSGTTAGQTSHGGVQIFNASPRLKNNVSLQLLTGAGAAVDALYMTPTNTMVLGHAAHNLQVNAPTTAFAGGLDVATNISMASGALQLDSANRVLSSNSNLLLQSAFGSIIIFREATTERGRMSSGLFQWGTTFFSGANPGDILLASGKYIRWVNAANTAIGAYIGLDSAGQLGMSGFTWNAHSYPGADAAHNLGSSARRIGTLYASGIEASGLTGPGNLVITASTGPLYLRGPLGQGIYIADNNAAQTYIGGGGGTTNIGAALIVTGNTTLGSATTNKINMLGDFRFRVASAGLLDLTDTIESVYRSFRALNLTAMGALSIAGASTFAGITQGDGVTNQTFTWNGSGGKSLVFNTANLTFTATGNPLIFSSAGGFAFSGTVDFSKTTFGAALGQHINLYSTSYGLGIQGSTMYFRTGSEYAWFLNGAHSDVALDPGSGGVMYMRLTSSGHLFPGSSSNTQDLGGISNQWRNLFVGGYVRFGDGTTQTTAASSAPVAYGRIWRSGNQSVGDASATRISLNVSELASGVSNDVTTNFRITVSNAGFYDVYGQAEFTGPTEVNAKVRRVYIYKNGLEVSRGQASSTDQHNTIVSTARTIQAAASDYFELVVYIENSGGPLDIVGGQGQTYLQLHRVG